MYRQGDVLIVPVTEGALPAHVAHAPRERRDGRGRLVLALGEVTGHAHAVVGPGELVREPGSYGPFLLHLPQGGRVVHEEHAAIAAQGLVPRDQTAGVRARIRPDRGGLNSGWRRGT